jgi:hypothetical protein
VVISVKIAKTLKGQLNFNLKMKDQYSKQNLGKFAMAMKKRLTSTKKLW